MTNAEIKIAEPPRIRKRRIICCQVFKVERFTVFNPASVIALTHRKRESVKLTLWDGVEDPQNMTAEKRPVKMK